MAREPERVLRERRAGRRQHVRTPRHEWYDGTGYPYGLQGHEISRAARIVAVADCYEVMTTSRTYKRALNPAAARKELARCAGTQFDPAMVRAFLNISLGRLRLAMGPLAMLSTVPSMARLSSLFEAAGPLACAGAVMGGAALIVGGGVMPSPGPSSDLPADVAQATEIDVATPTTVVLSETIERLEARRGIGLLEDEDRGGRRKTRADRDRRRRDSSDAPSGDGTGPSAATSRGAPQPLPTGGGNAPSPVDAPRQRDSDPAPGGTGGTGGTAAEDRGANPTPPEDAPGQEPEPPDGPPASPKPPRNQRADGRGPG